MTEKSHAMARLRLFPLNAVLFPGAVLNLHVFEPRYTQMIGECIKAGEGFGVVLIREGREAGDPAVQPYDVGSIAEIVEVTPLPFNRYYVSTIGRRRFRIREVLSREPFLTVEAELLEEEAVAAEIELRGLAESVRDLYLEYAELLAEFSGESESVDLPGGAAEMSYAIGYGLAVGDALKQRLLEISDTKRRLELESGILRRLLPQLRRLLEERREHAAGSAGAPDEERERQTRYFGKYFSSN